MSINSMRLFIVGALVISMLPGCAVISVEKEDPQIALIRKQAEKQPDSAPLQIQLLDAYIKNYHQSKKKSDLVRAIGQARIALHAAPEHAGIQVVLYQMLVQQGFQQRDHGVVTELTTLYKMQPGIKQTPLPPPSFVDAMIDLSGPHPDSDMPTIKAKLKQALMEKPNDVGSRVILADIYTEEKHPELALAMLSQAAEYAPDNAGIQSALGDAYSDSAHAAKCAVDQTDDIDRSIKAYKAAVAIKPDNAQFHNKLALAYELQGSADLYLYEAREAARLDITTGKALLADAFMSNDRIAEAIPLYEGILAQHPNNDTALLSLARGYFYIGQWQKSIETWSRYKALNDEPYFYGILLESLAISRLKGMTEGKAVLMNGIKRDSLQEWQQHLFDYELDRLSEQALIAKADNTCWQTEAEFYVGYRHSLQGNAQNAKSHWQKTLDLGAFAYIEHTAAHYALTRLEP